MKVFMTFRQSCSWVSYGARCVQVIASPLEPSSETELSGNREARLERILPNLQCGWYEISRLRKVYIGNSAPPAYTKHVA
jgi:hypothetical protein